MTADDFNLDIDRKIVQVENFLQRKDIDTDARKLLEDLLEMVKQLKDDSQKSLDEETLKKRMVEIGEVTKSVFRIILELLIDNL